MPPELLHHCPPQLGKGEERQGRARGGIRAGRSLISDFHRQNRLPWADWFHLAPIKSGQDYENSKLNLKTPSPAPAQLLPGNAAFSPSQICYPRGATTVADGLGLALAPLGMGGASGSFSQQPARSPRCQNLPQNPTQRSSSFQTTKSRER